MDYIIADTHFGDESVRIFERREKNDEDIIVNWNNTVKESDTVYVAGDFAIADKAFIKHILEKLNGKKILIMGNHDTLSYRDYIDVGFSEVYRHPILLDDFWIISHEPLYVTKFMPYANIFGHVHSNPSYKDYSERSFCVCVERINYTPILFSDVKKKVQETANSTK